MAAGEDETKLAMQEKEVQRLRDLISKLQLLKINLAAGETVVHNGEATGHARQLVPDEKFLQGTSLPVKFF